MLLVISYSGLLSESVSKALTLTGGPGVVGTAAFAEMFNKFFDIMNVTNFVSAKKKINVF